MKRVLIVILAFVYLGLSTGVVKNLHYCMGQLSNVEYGYDQHNTCGECGMKEKDGCCNTELKIVKLEDSHLWVKSESIIKNSLILSATDSYQLVFIMPCQYSIHTPSYHSPPDQRTNFIYLHTGVLLV